MENLDYWLICDELSVNQAALLQVGVDPGEKLEYWPVGYLAARTALRNAVRSGRLRATVRHTVPEFWEGDADSDLEGYEDWDRTTVVVDDLREWLLSRGIKTGFYFPNQRDVSDCLNKDHKRYAPKLAAALRGGPVY